MLLPALYHWSPSDRHDDILREGLLLYSSPVTHSGEERYPYLCFSPTPSSAWGLSGDMEWTTDIERWDLWQVRLTEGDEVRIQPNFGPVIREVRVCNSIPADRVWYVASREPRSAKSPSSE